MPSAETPSAWARVATAAVFFVGASLIIRGSVELSRSMSDSPSEVAWLLWNAILLLFTAVFIGCGVFFAWDVERARRPIRRRWICVVLLIASALPFLQRLPENDAPSTFAKEVFARFAIAAVPGLAVAALLIRRSKRRADGGGRVTST